MYFLCNMSSCCQQNVPEYTVLTVQVDHLLEALGLELRTCNYNVNVESGYKPSDRAYASPRLGISGQRRESKYSLLPQCHPC